MASTGVSRRLILQEATVPADPIYRDGVDRGQPEADPPGGHRPR